MSDKGLQRNFGIWTAVFAVFASMIGSGIFGNTGMILAKVGDPMMTLLLWALYGFTALAGALCYAELAALMPHPGGEYVYLREVFGKLPSFLTGWVSFIVGFAAPAALSAILAISYLSSLVASLSAENYISQSSILYEYIIVAAQTQKSSIILKNLLQENQVSTDSISYWFFFVKAHILHNWNAKILASGLILFFSFVHSMRVKSGSYLQNFLTVLKLGIVAAFVIGGLIILLQGGGSQTVAETFRPRPVQWSGIGLGLLWTLYAFSGWNGASYLAGEIRNPEKNVPRALFWGTLLTTGIYMVMNVIYMIAVPYGEMKGTLTVAALAGRALFGEGVGILFNAAFCLILLSTLSALVMIGPRVYYAMARDGMFFSLAGRLTKKGQSPAISIFAQAALAIIYVLSGTYGQILTYMGFALNIFPILTIFALVKMRRDRPDLRSPYRTPFFPILPIFYALVSFFIMAAAFFDEPLKCLFALGIVSLGVPVYYLWNRFFRPADSST